ncbi:TIGR04255 family protein [Legionella lytica]|uniref:TIGR04255 family protein n=1 Tax=Legionella lytica TaxID=96232 RepID=A0ABW8DAB1_9GAMM
MKKLKYNKPQIQEAIFEAKFDYENFDVAMPGQIFELIKNEYPTKLDYKHFSIAFSENSNLPPLIQAPLIRASNKDNSEVLQFGPGITVANDLKYESWKSFEPKISKILAAYIDIAKPINVNRIGTRYINNIHIPIDNINVSDYFNLDIQIPSQLSNMIGLELVFINEATRNNNTFTIRTKFSTEAIKPNENGARFILDLDCYIEKQFDCDRDYLISLAKDSHDILEDFFEAIINNNTRQILEVIND